MRYLLLPASIVIAAINAAACSTLTVSSETGKSTVEGVIGNSVVETGSYPLVIGSRGLGIFTRRDGVTIGWLNETRVYISIEIDKCRTIILTDHVDEIKSVIAALEAAKSSLSDICVLKQETDR